VKKNSFGKVEGREKSPINLKALRTLTRFGKVNRKRKNLYGRKMKRAKAKFEKKKEKRRIAKENQKKLKGGLSRISKTWKGGGGGEMGKVGRRRKKGRLR